MSLFFPDFTLTVDGQQHKVLRHQLCTRSSLFRVFFTSYSDEEVKVCVQEAWNTSKMLVAPEEISFGCLLDALSSGAGDLDKLPGKVFDHWGAEGVTFGMYLVVEVHEGDHAIHTRTNCYLVKRQGLPLEDLITLESFDGKYIQHMRNNAMWKKYWDFSRMYRIRYDAKGFITQPHGRILKEINVRID